MEAFTPQIVQLVSSLGLGAVLSLFGAWAFFKILNRIFDENEKRDIRIAAILDGSVKDLSAKTESLAQVIISHESKESEAFAVLREADKFQREEHARMIQALEKITERNVA